MARALFFVSLDYVDGFSDARPVTFSMEEITMTAPRVSLGTVVGTVGLVLLVPVLAFGAPPGWAGPSLPLEGTTSIATGASSGLDGYLGIAPDDYGSWASTTFGGGGDMFNPAGGSGALEVAFSSGFFVFVPSAGQRELLSDSADWQNVFTPDFSLDRSITSPLMASDTSGNGVADTLNSAFNVFGGSTNLGFDLTQRVSSFDAGVSFMQQDYTITNNGNGSVAFQLVRPFDADMLWSGDFGDDEVGTGFHGSGLDPFVFQQEVGDSTTAMTLSSPQGRFYYGGKNGVDPGGVPFAYGTDTQVWDMMGIPASWQDYIAGVGAGINGTSGAFPPGSVTPADGAIGLDMSIALDPGESTLVSLMFTYGSNVPAPEPGTLAILGLGVLCMRRRWVR